ncbi:hypothetical protein ONE63_006463 [Megalurothrips usitatus]|uniref:Uncharacterized protein n=1 Tax=Megalurothrips usitatus TaxID=439358 RepID=A0AAV7XU36_9NEOP|nr:hypothetical protein ONE63_006463 [Megalurothrips usitatus]
MSALFSDVMAHLMVALFATSLIRTLQVLVNSLDLRQVAPATLILGVFLPLATMSQTLTDASAAMSESAYRAAAEARDDEAVDVRRAMQLVMVAASRPACLAFKGFGPLSLRSAGAALKAWYQWVNLLVSISE